MDNSTFKPIEDLLKEDFIGKIIALSEKRKVCVYLVGGFIRDAFLGRKKEKLDVDFAVDRGAIELARAFAKETKSGFVVLDKEHGCARVIYCDYTLDFTDFRGRDLKGDLLKRDFTINTLALALPVQKNIGDSLIDYCHAIDDLKKSVIRMVSKDSFKGDYLRIFRAFSLSALFKFKIEKNTLSLAKKDKGKLLDVSGERVRDEFFKILDVDDSIVYVKELDKHKILSFIIPQIELMRRVKQGGYHHLDVWEHSLEALRQFEKFILEIKNKPDVNNYLEEKLSAERRRRQLLKLVCLLHDIGKPQSRNFKKGRMRFHGHERIGKDISKVISEKLKLSTRERFAIDTMIFWHLRPGYLADSVNISKRAKFRYFRDTQTEAVSILVLSIADQRATRGPLSRTKDRLKHEKITFRLIDEFFRSKEEKKFVRLINGDDLIKKLKLTPSPLFKEILQEVEESQAEGKVKTKKEALELAEKVADEN